MQNTQTVLKLLRNPEGEGKPTPEDKLRLVIVFYLSVPESAISKDDIAELEKELKSSGAEINAFEYVRRIREISKMSVPGALGGASTPVVGGQQAGELFRGFGALGNRVSGFVRLAPSMLLMETCVRARRAPHRYLHLHFACAFPF